MVRTIVPTSRYDIGGGAGWLANQYTGDFNEGAFTPAIPTTRFDVGSFNPDNLSTPFAKIQITGSEEVMKNLSHILATSYKKALIRLRQNGEKILSASKEEVPWETTHLLQTGTVEFVKGGSFTAKYWEEGMEEVDTRTETLDDTEDDMVVIGYNTPYGLRQHEDLSFFHPKIGRKAKFLEDPAMRIAPSIAEDIVNALKSELG